MENVQQLDYQLEKTLINLVFCPLYRIFVAAK